MPGPSAIRLSVTSAGMRSLRQGPSSRNPAPQCGIGNCISRSTSQTTRTDATKMMSADFEPMKRNISGIHGAGVPIAVRTTVRA